MEIIELELLDTEQVALELGDRGSLGLELEHSQGTNNYSALVNKPSIEGHILVGDSTIQQIGVGTLSVSEIEKILYL